MMEITESVRLYEKTDYNEPIQMGVRSLWKLIQPAEENIIPARKTLAIDTSIWIHQLIKLDDSRMVYTATKRILRILYEEIRPVFVFDGAVPAEKVSEMKRRAYEREERSLKSDDDKINTKGKTIDEILEEAKMRNCNELTEEEFLERIHKKYKWGEYYNDADLELFTSDSDEETDRYGDVEMYLCTKTSKLQKLLDLRAKRKNTLSFNDKSLETFSESQVKNALKRNSVTSLIKELSDTHVIQSDSKRAIKFTREKKDRTRTDQDIANEIIQLSKDFDHEEDEDSWEENIEIPSFDTGKGEESDYRGKKRPHTIDLRSGTCNDDRPSADEDTYSEESADLEIRGAIDEERKRIDKQRSRFSVANSRFIEVQDKLKTLIRILGLPTLDSPMEADSQCARLVIEGVVEGVVSEDSDLVLYGVPVYKNFFKKNREIALYTQENIYKKLGWTQMHLIKLGFLLGTDYSPGISGIGPKKAVKLVEEVEEKDVKLLTNIYLHPAGFSLAAVKLEAFSKNELLSFLSKSKVSKEAQEELLFYIEKCKLFVMGHSQSDRVK